MAARAAAAGEMPRAMAAAERARMAEAATVARARDAEAEPSRPPVPTVADEPMDFGPAPVPTVADDPSDAITRTLRQLAEETKLPAEERDRAVIEANEGRGSRRDLLPDIEEINSSLRPDERALAAAGEDEAAAQAGRLSEADRRSGFRLGFALIVGLVAILVGFYVLSGPIAAAVPALSGLLAAYAGFVDGLRIALAERVDALTASILAGR